jgi:hypothetical protein
VALPSAEPAADPAHELDRPADYGLLVPPTEQTGGRATG